MADWKSEPEAREEIKEMVTRYYHAFKEESRDGSFSAGDRIPYASRVYDEKEMCALLDSCLDFWLTSGRFAEQFEKDFAAWLGVKHAHLVNSGSSANLLAFMVLTSPELGERRICRGDEVITVACAFPTTIAPILQYGAVPVFVDITIPQYNIDVSRLEDALSSKTKAVMVAHTLGNPFDIASVKAFCDTHNLWLIEDNCDSLGSIYSLDGQTDVQTIGGAAAGAGFSTGTDSNFKDGAGYGAGVGTQESPKTADTAGHGSDHAKTHSKGHGKGRKEVHTLQWPDILLATGKEYAIANGQAPMTRYTGTWGDIGTSSFYPPHHMTMGEGGCVYTDNPLLSRLILSYRDWGRDCICPSGQDNFCGNRFSSQAGQYGELPAGYDHKYVYSHIGYNLKATDMQAAIGVEQLKKLPDFISCRRHNWKYLNTRLQEELQAAAAAACADDGTCGVHGTDTDTEVNADVYAEVYAHTSVSGASCAAAYRIMNALILPEPEPYSVPSWFGYIISVRPQSGLKRNDITRYLEEHGIQTRLLFAGNIIKHPCFDSIRDTDAYRVAGSLGCTNYAMDNSFWVGVYPGMTDAMIDYIAKTIAEAVAGRCR